MRNVIGIDNGVTGSIGIITESRVSYSPMPTFKMLNYQKSKAKNITRISAEGLEQHIRSVLSGEAGTTMALIERPFVNPKMFNSTMSAVRALEVVLIVFERLKIGYNYIDSKEWQRELIPGYTFKTPNVDLKSRSLEIGKRMYPALDWTDFKDADGLLIAHYLRTQWDAI